MKDKLQTLDHEIAEKKAFYQLLVTEIEKIEKLIKERQYRTLWTVSMPLYDGFNCTQLEVQERDKTIQKECPYQEENALCETLIDYKIETLAYQKQKVRKMLQKYNELACLLFALQHYNQKKYCIKPYLLLNLEQIPTMQLSYYATDDLTYYEGKCENLFIFYRLDATQVMIETIPLVYRSHNEALSGTSLKTNDTLDLWIEIEPRFLQTPIRKMILKQVQEVVLFLRRHGKKIGGSFISLKDLSCKAYQEAIRNANEIDYQVIGKVIQSQFFENQLLIWSYRSKK